MQKFLKSMRAFQLMIVLGVIFSIGLSTYFYKTEITHHHKIMSENHFQGSVQDIQAIDSKYKRVTNLETLGVLISSLIITILFSGFLYSRIKREEQIEKVIHQKTKEITTSNQRLESEIRQRQLTEKILAKKVLEAQLMHKVVINVSVAKTISEALQVTINAICQLTTWSVGHVYSVENKDNVKKLIPSDLWFTIDQHTFQPLKEVTMKTVFMSGEGLPGRVMQSGQACCISDINKDGHFVRNKIVDNLGVKGAFAFPVMVFGEIVAVLEFFHKDEIKADESFVKIIRALGVQLGQILERKQVDEKVKEEKERLEVFQKLTVNREIEMIGLKKQINELNRLMGKIPPYDLSFIPEE